MNIFYTSPDNISGSNLELTGQEAVHAARVLRYKPGDSITVVDGRGGWYVGTIQQIQKKFVQVKVDSVENKPPVNPNLVLGLGIIKKRDRMEFAVEKAVELGVSAIALFRGEHTIKENVRMDRLESIVLSAMKQSLRAWLPEVRVYDSISKVVTEHSGFRLLVAHKGTENGVRVQENPIMDKEKFLLLVGPEGGFSEPEIDFILSKRGHIISLGDYRLRTETAAVAFLSQFI